MTAADHGGDVETLKALAHPLRLTILRALARGERSVGDLEQSCGIGQPALSQQLAVLRRAELVTTRRDHKLIFYAVDNERLESLVALIDGLKAPLSKCAGRIGVADAPGSTAAVFARIF